MVFSVVKSDFMRNGLCWFRFHWCGTGSTHGKVTTVVTIDQSHNHTVHLSHIPQCIMQNRVVHHDDVVKWKHFPRYWPFMRGIHRPPMNSPHKGQWRGALLFSLICAWTNGWGNHRNAGDLRCYRAHYDVTVMTFLFWMTYCGNYGNGGSGDNVIGDNGGNGHNSNGVVAAAKTMAMATAVTMQKMRQRQRSFTVMAMVTRLGMTCK